ncbi:MAG: cytochrome c biogenesis protein CcdA [Glaciecola sp.]
MATSGDDDRCHILGWSALLLIALLDSVNPSALIVTLMLLARPKGASAVLPYVLGIFVTYFAMGLALVSGFDFEGDALERALEHPIALVAELLIGLTLLVVTWRAPKQSQVAERQRTLGRKSLAGLFLLGATATATELPTALPYLAATGLMGTSDLGRLDVLVQLAVYCTIFVSPPLLLAAVQALLGGRAGPRYERLRKWLYRTARETLLWLVGILGFFLAVHGAVELGSLLD